MVISANDRQFTVRKDFTWKWLQGIFLEEDHCWVNLNLGQNLKHGLLKRRYTFLKIDQTSPFGQKTKITWSAPVSGKSKIIYSRVISLTETLDTEAC